MQSHLIKNIISQGEGQQLDFKHSVKDAQKIARTLVAFANTDGGTLLLGVKDNGNIAGIKSEEEIYMIETASILYCKPEVQFYSNTHLIEGKNIAEIIVEPSANKKHSAPTPKGEYKVYIRKNDENLLANRVLLEVYRLKTKNISPVIEYDNQIKQIFNALNENGEINRSIASTKLGISKYKADNIFIKMILMDLIVMDITSNGAWYYLKNEQD